MTSQWDTSVQTVHFAKTVLKTFVIYCGNIIMERRPENQLGSFLLLFFWSHLYEELQCACDCAKPAYHSVIHTVGQVSFTEENCTTYS